MISVLYGYRNKRGEWNKYDREFSDRISALRFIRGMKRKENYQFISYTCEYPDDNDWLWRRI